MVDRAGRFRARSGYPGGPIHHRERARNTNRPGPSLVSPHPAGGSGPAAGNRRGADRTVYTAWNEEAAIDSAHFAACITLQTVIFYPDGSAELFYDDGDLFAGHVILVSLDTYGALQDATLAG